MKILAVSQFYTPDITAAAFRVAETVDDLQELGNEVEVVTTFPHKSKISGDIESGKNGVHRVHLPGTENKGFLGYIYLYLSFFFKSIFKGLRIGLKQKPDVVWASSPPIFVGLAGWVLAKMLSANFALDIRDIWPDSAVAAGQISDSGFSYKVGRQLEKFLYRHADVITCVATPMQKYIQEYTDTEVEVIYNGVELSSNGIGESNNLESSILNNWTTYKTSKKILYAGNFGHVQQLDLLIDAFAEIQNEDLEEEWEIFFLGGGVQKENLEQKIILNNISEKIHLLNPVPKEDVFDYLISADVLFIHLMDSEVLRLTIPSKVFDYMLANKPLLAGIYGEGKNIIENIDGNITFRSGDQEHLKEAFKEMDQKISGISGRLNNAQTVKAKYSRESQSKKLHRIFKKNFSS